MRIIIKYLAFVPILFSASLFTACAAYMPPSPLPPTPTALPGTIVPFKTIDLGNYSGHLETSEQLIVATTEPQLDEILELIPWSDNIDAIQAVDLKEEIVLGVFRSPGHHFINVIRVFIHENTVYVYAEFPQRRPDEGVVPEPAYPFQVITVPRVALPIDGIEWVLVSYPTYFVYHPPADWYPPPSPLATPTDVPGISVAFDSVLSGYDSRFSGETAHLLVAETATERATLAALLYGVDAEEMLAAVALDEHVLIGLFLPPREHTGHALAITRIVVQENRATVYAEAREPQPPHGFNPAQLHLYHIVRVPRADLPTGEIEWALVTYPMYVYPPWLEYMRPP